MRRDPRPSASALGRIGEEICRQWLLSQGFSILDSNYTCKLGEIDIIATKGHTIVFVEVKTRTHRSMGSPAEAVDSNKQRRIRRVALHYLSEGRVGLESDQLSHIRFDVAGVTVDWRRRCAHLHWISNAF